MSAVVLVHGTFGRASSWHLPGSPVIAELEALGHTVWDFKWSGVLAGVPTALPGDPAEAKVGADQGTLLPWLSEGEKLALFLETHGLDRPCVISHSHGLQVVAFSCWAGAAYDVALSISGPIRQDMQRCRRFAQTRIRAWYQYADPNPLEDRTIIEGEFFGGFQGIGLPEGITIPTPGTGHSGLLTDASLRRQVNPWASLPTA